MNVGQFRSHLETLPDDALIVFQPHEPDTPIDITAMAVSFTVKPFLFPDGKASRLGIFGLVTDDRDYPWSILKEPELLYKGSDGFYVNIVNRRICEDLPDEGVVRFMPHHEANLPIGAELFPPDFFPAIGVFAYAGLNILPNSSEGVTIDLIRNDRDYPSPADLA